MVILGAFMRPSGVPLVKSRQRNLRPGFHSEQMEAVCFDSKPGYSPHSPSDHHHHGATRSLCIIDCGLHNAVNQWDKTFPFLFAFIAPSRFWSSRVAGCCCCCHASSGGLPFIHSFVPPTIVMIFILNCVYAGQEDGR